MNASADSQLESPVDRPALSPDDAALLTRSSLYREFLAERDEIHRHKWFESEKAGRDIGFEHALASWVVPHRANWLRARRSQVIAA